MTGPEGMTGTGNDGDGSQASVFFGFATVVEGWRKKKLKVDGCFSFFLSFSSSPGEEGMVL